MYIHLPNRSLSQDHNQLEIRDRLDPLIVKAFKNRREHEEGLKRERAEKSDSESGSDCMITSVKPAPRKKSNKNTTPTVKKESASHDHEDAPPDLRWADLESYPGTLQAHNQERISTGKRAERANRAERAKRAVEAKQAEDLKLHTRQGQKLNRSPSK